MTVLFAVQVSTFQVHLTEDHTAIRKGEKNLSAKVFIGRNKIRELLLVFDNILF